MAAIVPISGAALLSPISVFGIQPVTPKPTRRSRGVVLGSEQARQKADSAVDIEEVTAQLASGLILNPGAVIETLDPAGQYCFYANLSAASFVPNVSVWV